MTINLEVPEIVALTEQIATLADKVAALHEKVTGERPWYDLHQACAMKGVNYLTVKGRRELQPNRGVEDDFLGRRVWKPETVKEWCKSGTWIQRKKTKSEIRTKRPA